MSMNISAAERKAKIEKLKKDRELKEKERLVREAEQKKSSEQQATSNDLIQRILQSTAQEKIIDAKPPMTGMASALEMRSP
jgi:Skp family chaperone for outer membrane proteins